jgi:hypothetical protein
VSANVILRGAELALHAERAPGAPEATYVAECLLCRAESGLADYGRKPVAVWSIEHTRHHGPDHGQFLLTTQTHWRVGPLPSPPVPVATARTPRHHAANRRARTLAESLPLIALLVGTVLLLGIYQGMR